MTELWFAISILPWWYWLLVVVILYTLFLWRIDYFVSKTYFGFVKLKRVAQVTAGFGLWSSISWVFDNIAYPSVIAWRGLVEGGIIMTVLAILITTVFLLVYEYKKVDWMGVDALRLVRDNGDAWIKKFDGSRYSNIFAHYFVRILMYFPVLFLRVALWMLNKGDIFAFIGLSIISDSFVTTIYLRHGRFDGLRKKDWIIFFASGILANFYWTLRSYGLVVAVRYFLNIF